MKIASHLASLEILWPYLHRKHSILDAMIFLFIADHDSCSCLTIEDHFEITNAIVTRSIQSLGGGVYGDNSPDLVEFLIPLNDGSKSGFTLKTVDRENDDISVHLTKKGIEVVKTIKEVSHD